MNIVKEDVDALNAVIRVSIVKDDYAEAVEKSLKDYRKKANINGFRTGMAPMGLIRKMYYKYIIVDVVSRLATDKLFDYIKENNIKTLGEPIPCENQPEIDWETAESFDFAWDLGIAPQFEVKLNKRDKFPMYKITIDDEVRSKYIESYTNRYGEYKPTDVADDKSLLKVALSELNADESPRENGISVDDASISIALVATEDDRNKLIGSKVGDVQVIDVTKFFPNETDRAALLKVKKDELAEILPTFQMTVTDIQTYVPAELNQDLFDKVFGEGTVTSLDEFNGRLDSMIEQNFNSESDARFFMDAKQKMVELVKFDLPKDFLIRWLTTANEGKFTREQIEAEYPAFEKDLKWQLISNSIAEEQKFTVEKEEVEAFAKNYARSQFAMYGASNLPEEYIDRYAADLMKKEKEVKHFYESVMDEKVVGWIKENVAFNTKTVTADEFFKMK